MLKLASLNIAKYMVRISNDQLIFKNTRVTWFLNLNINIFKTLLNLYICYFE